MSSHMCHICGSNPGDLYPELAPFLSVPVCDYCLKPSYGCNTRSVGRVSHLPSFSVEFEVEGSSHRDCEKALALLPLGYLRTRDCSVDDEYKSPIYYSLDVFRFHLPILHSLRDLVGHNCGTHLHVGLPAHMKKQVIRLRYAMFAPFIKYLDVHSRETEDFWGRTLCYYASDDLNDSFCCVHTESRYDTLEFRLPRFRNAHQYLAVVRFCRRVTYYIHCSLLSRSSSPAQVGTGVLRLYHEALGRYTTSLLKGAHTKMLSPTCIASSF